MTMRTYLEKIAASAPNATAITFYNSNKEWQNRSWAEFHSRVRRAAGAYGPRFSLKPGSENVALMLANCPTWVEAYIALARSAEGRGDAKSAVAYATVVTSLFDDDELCAEAKKIIEAHKEGSGQ